MRNEKEFWIKDDEIKKADLLESEPPQDRFKREYSKIVKKTGISDKPTRHKIPNINKLRRNIRSQTVEKWTTQRYKFGNDKGHKQTRLFDNLPPAHDERKDYDPMYSSFNHSKVFHAPPSSCLLYTSPSPRD